MQKEKKSSLKPTKTREHSQKFRFAGWEKKVLSEQRLAVKGIGLRNGRVKSGFGTVCQRTNFWFWGILADPKTF